MNNRTITLKDTWAEEVQKGFPEIPRSFITVTMKSSKYAWFRRISFLVAGLVLLSSSACKKSIPKDLSASLPSSASLSPAASKQQRLEWNLTTLVEAYEQAGHSNPKWDEFAKRALTEFARSRAQIPGTQPEVISTNVATAVQAGCDDPMVNYLFIKYAMDQTNSKEAFAVAFLKTAQDMVKSSYPEIRKFYAAYRAVNQFTWANNYPTNWPVEITDLTEQMGNSLYVMLNDKTVPSGEIYDACHEFLFMWQGDRNQEEYKIYYDRIEPPLFKNWPNDPNAWLLKGETYIQLAWHARGDGTADKVTQSGWKLFKKQLEIAENALTNAWALNPNDPQIADQMMHVELGQGRGRERLEMWFSRAMKLNTNNYTACKDKLNYLAPKWYGSFEDMLQFGRECVRNKKWGGQVPLALVDVHVWIQSCDDCLNKSEQAAYWKQPDVWNDIQAAYERFFESNPQAVSYYHNYARYAYQAEQWNKLNELIPKLGAINYKYFGGKEEYDKMLRLAKEHAGNPE